MLHDEGLAMGYVGGFLPHNPFYKNELNCECYNITSARKNIAP